MNKSKKLFHISLLIIFFSSSMTAFGQTISFIHLNDLHAHLTPHKDLVTTPKGGTEIVERGGIARIATLINAIRLENPNNVLMNIGDTFHGGVEALYTVGNAIIDPVAKLGIDIGVPGNWDFAYGPIASNQRFGSLGNDFFSSLIINSLGTLISTQRARRVPYPVLAANVNYSLFPGTKLAPATRIINVGGIKVGFIGLTSDIVPKMSSKLAIGFNFIQGEENHKNIINHYTQVLKNQLADIIVVMSELGIQKDYRLANIINPGVDIIFSAHTHEATFIPLVGTHGTLVVEAGNDGYLGRMDVTIENSVITGHKWSLLEVDDSIIEEEDMKTLVDAARSPFLAEGVRMEDPLKSSTQWLEEPIDTVVGHSDKPLHRRHALENPFNNLFTDLLVSKIGTRVALTPGFRFDSVIENDSVSKGAITLEDVYRYFPSAYKLAIGRSFGYNVKKIMENALTQVYSPNIFKQKGGWFEGWSGLHANLRLSNPDGRRIETLAFSDTGEAIEDTTVFSVTGCVRPFEAAGVMCSHPGFSLVTVLTNPNLEPGVPSRPWTNIDFFVDALAETKRLPVSKRKDMIDLDDTPAWPDTGFIQPLEGVGIAPTTTTP